MRKRLSKRRQICARCARRAEVLAPHGNVQGAQHVRGGHNRTHRLARRGAAEINDNRRLSGRAAPLVFKAEALCLEGAGN